MHFPAITARFGALSLAALLLANFPAGAHEFELGDLDIAHPWSRQTPAGAKIAVGYLIIKNGSSAPDRLVSATADIAGKTEFHEMAMTEGVMTMRPLGDGLEIPAGGEARFEPGGFHLMFKDLKRAPIKGETFAGTLTFEKAGTIAVEFTVEAPSGAHGDHGG